MGKRIISRARGKGGPRYRSPGHRFAGAIKYPDKDAIVIDIVHDPGRDAPLAKIRQEDGKEILIVAAEGMKVGDKISEKRAAETGNILKLSKIPKSTNVFAVENLPKSGPKLCCSPGTHAIIISHEPGRVIVQMPSKAFKFLNPNCMATVGIPAGGGQRDKPFVKAGQKFFAMEARNKLYPRTSANKMNPVDHPFGGRTKPGTPKSLPRNAPPGAKVGSIASRRTGRRKK